ncbi:hypothetical protein QIH80_22420 [Bradyrhizobium elkanii]|nr:hypothetical protein QIH80_22420 [Bradyrhizobium elkanii]
MSDNRFFNTHRPWEDWFGMLLGVLIMVSPWFPMQVSGAVDIERSHLVLNSFMVGMLVLGIAQLEYVALHRWEEVASILLGLWLMASPLVFGLRRGPLAAVLAHPARRGGRLYRRVAAVAGLEPERAGNSPSTRSSGLGRKQWAGRRRRAVSSRCVRRALPKAAAWR